MRKKKYQIFISSTYLDLQDERQAAVEAILGSKHIPAGMELFRAGNRSQLDTIKKWIDESDLYMLILGGRYGSIEPEGGKSYTHIEYEYALEKGIPVFAVVLSNSFLHNKASKNEYEVFEKDNKEKYDEFKKYVMTKMIKEVDDCKDIKIAIKDSIVELEDDYHPSGWIKAIEIDDNTKIIKENNDLLRRNKELENKVKILEEQENKNIEAKKLANGEDKIKIQYMYCNNSLTYQRSEETIEITWNNLFRIIAPELSGNIINPGEWEDILNSQIENYIGCEYDNILLLDESLNTIKYQLEGLNLIDISSSNGYEAITITENGEKLLRELYTIKK